MSRKVYITSDMGLDEALFAVAEADWEAALLWPWLLTSLDDWGRGYSSAPRLKKTIFPDWPGITSSRIAEAITLLAEYGLLVLYGDESEYMAASEESWRKYQTHIRWDRKGKAVSKFPDYPGVSGSIPAVPGDSPPSPSPSPSYPPTPLNLGPVDDLLTLAATVKSAKASWKPKQTDAEMFGTLLERFPPGQLRDELQKFKGYALQRDWSRFGRAFVNWMNRVEPQKIPPSHVPYVAPAEPELSEAERAASLETLRQARQQLRQVRA